MGRTEHTHITDTRGFFQALLGDGRPFISVTGLALVASGAFALFLSLTGHFLPHDVQFLGMTARDLCKLQQCRVVHFMFHDRVSFGGVLIALGTLYLWLAEFPLKRGQAWAWWLLLVSGVEGFGSFLAYLGYGYLDTWHGVATLVLLPIFILGLWRSHRLIRGSGGIGYLFMPARPLEPCSACGLGRILLGVAGGGLIGGGLVIMTVGMTSVFVPTDLTFIGLSAEQLRAVHPHLVPLIAHDRAGFGGGVCCCGILVLACAWCATPSRALWQALCLAGAVGFSCAIGVHPAIGYTNWFHLLPAELGAAVYAAGLALTFPAMMRGRTTHADRAIERRAAYDLVHASSA